MNYNSIIKAQKTVKNHEGEKAFKMSPEMELYTAVVTSAMSDSAYGPMDKRTSRIASLIRKVSPTFVAQLAVYARTKMNLHSIPLLLLVELAKIHNGDSLVSNTIEKTVLRADEIAELLMCYQWRNDKGQETKKLGRLSRQVQNGLKKAFNNFDEYQFAKYDRKNQTVKLKDALFLVHPKAKDAAQQEIFDKIAQGRLAVPYTWETQMSALGQEKFESEDLRKEAVKKLWEELIDSGKVGYMALMRNLCNIIKADVSYGHIKAVCDLLSSPDQVRRSKQLPFRYLAAYREVSKCRSVHVQTILSALEDAVKVSAANIDGFGPETNVLIAADVSGSMKYPVSRNSSIERYDIGLLLSMILKSRCESVIGGIFGDSWKTINLPKASILANTIELRKREGEVGYSTNGYKVIDWLLENKVWMDKVMIFTDCQMWDSTGTGKNIKDSWKKYQLRYPKAMLYLFDLCGYGTSPIELKNGNVVLIAGWSDKVFEVLSGIENGKTALSEIKKIIV